MQVSVKGDGPVAPFLGARDVFETEHELTKPVSVRVRSDPDERTSVSHESDRHVLRTSRAVATSELARELALHEYAHMWRHEQGHPSHTIPTEEVLFLALAGRRVERRVLTHCYQIANHAKDIYADQITLALGSGEKLAAFLESELASALANGPANRPGHRVTAGADPSITAVNAAFALALLEGHDAIEESHRLYDLAHAAGQDAPAIDVSEFRRLFARLSGDPDGEEYRRGLLDLIRAYVDAHEEPAVPAAD